MIYHISEQVQILLSLPVLLSAMLNVSVSRNWLLPTLAIMHLHAYLAQALPPVKNQRNTLTQLPSIQNKDVQSLSDTKTLTDVAEVFQLKKDERVSDIQKALERWGAPEIVNVTFKGMTSLFYVCYNKLIVLLPSHRGARCDTVIYCLPRDQTSPCAARQND